jgi:hypothetical protein
VPASGRRYRPPVGLPDADQRRGRWQGVVASIALHALVIMLLLAPVATTVVIHTDARSLGWLGAIRGGGGGGSPVEERLRYVQPAPAEPNAVPPPIRPTLRPRPRPTPRVVTPVPSPTPAPPPTPPAVTVPPAASVGAAAGAGGPGGGPGAGGGAGTGVGPGLGNGVGPGTGGAPTATKIKAVNTAMTPPSLGAPPRDRPFHLVATFEVSARGDARLLSVTKSRDNGFNDRVRDDLATFRFRPASLPNGVAVDDTVQVSFDY